ncbi:MAG: NAD(P)H-dependent oxidoreductase subunit E [Candidatus Rokubacteria bacterium]|nr:NAD(P)H-dependent oxidoreductase subunit E [Candidatus Rokubacteria bacterium]
MEQPGAVIVSELREIQHKFGYLPAEELRALSARLRVPVYQLHAVASFFPHFRLHPPAPVEVRVCADMSCHLNGARPLLGAFNTEAGRVSGVDVQTVSCLGRCDRAPAAAIGEHIIESVSIDEVPDLVLSAADGKLEPRPRVAAQPTSLRSDPYASSPRYEAVQQFVTNPDVEKVLGTLKAAGLRGMGGAGFPTADKWRYVRQASGDVKYIVCNADESEPGTIKDRFIMESVPHLLLEGMTMAGLVTGAKQGYIYLRHEYETCKEALEHAIHEARQKGVLGAQVLGSAYSFDIELFISPGGYICGEESALLEAMEGRRGEPRNKPPFPVTHGLYNKPTVINNVETLAFVPMILLKGPDWVKAQGQNGGSGLKFVGISGHVVRPGVYEVPMGIRARDLIYDLAGGLRKGRALKGWAPSGPSSGYLPPSAIDLPLEWDALAKAGSMLGSGAVVVMSEGTCMLDMALNAVRFFRNESCGKCVPCRVGTQKLVELLTRATRGQAGPDDLATIEDLDQAMRLASICGLGQIAAKPLTSVIQHFRDEVDEHLVRQRCPAGVCPMDAAASPADRDLTMTIMRRL